MQWKGHGHAEVGRQLLPQKQGDRAESQDHQYLLTFSVATSSHLEKDIIYI